jgi:hypothetical protein
VLSLLGIALLFDFAAVPQVTIGAVLVVMTVEAMLRRRLRFLLGAGIIVALIYTVWLVLDNWRDGLGVLALIGSVTVGVANLRSFLTRR